jgi:putative restriction endonuclease
MDQAAAWPPGGLGRAACVEGIITVILELVASWPSVGYDHLVQPFIALTDKAWFDFLASHAEQGIVDEVNFWSPKATQRLRHMEAGEPVFFRLKKPHYSIAGYGFYADFRLIDIDFAWELFSWKNGYPDKLRFLERIGSYRGVNLLDPKTPRAPLGCTILRAVQFWPESRWIPWDDRMGWPSHTMRGATEEDPARIEILLRSMQGAAPPEFQGTVFKPLEADERRIAMAAQIRREGQGAFRARLLGAYAGRCAITGEHTEPVLDAAHIQPYLGAWSNHIQNGLALTKEFHALFDRGYVTITPDLVVRVSPRLKTDWNNGRRYFPYDGKPLIQVPSKREDRPSSEALVWHNKRRFLDVVG